MTKANDSRLSDNLNQQIEYSYDAYNNLIQTNTSSSDNSLALRVQQAFDVRNRLVEIRAPQNDVRIPGDSIGIPGTSIPIDDLPFLV
ncbi:hypothetical protein JYU18_01385 [bacterium AH-315-E07]|nr:hypothetical protein [bacterium AH-315-E07]